MGDDMKKDSSIANICWVNQVNTLDHLAAWHKPLLSWSILCLIYKTGRENVRFSIKSLACILSFTHPNCFNVSGTGLNWLRSFGIICLNSISAPSQYGFWPNIPLNKYFQFFIICVLEKQVNIVGATWSQSIQLKPSLNNRSQTISTNYLQDNNDKS